MHDFVLTSSRSKLENFCGSNGRDLKRERGVIYIDKTLSHTKKGQNEILIASESKKFVHETKRMAYL